MEIITSFINIVFRNYLSSTSIEIFSSYQTRKIKYNFKTPIHFTLNLSTLSLVSDNCV